MPETLESRIEYLEQVVDAQLKLNNILFPMIFHHDDQFRSNAAEALRRALVSPAVKLSPILEQQIKILRDVLVLPIPQEVVEALRKPSIHLAE